MDPRYVHLDTAALDRLAEKGRYAEAGVAMDQARQLVGEAAAYRDAVVAAMVAARPGRGGQSEVARLLGVHRNIVSTAVKNHQERCPMERIVTVRDHRGNRDVTRTWTKATVHRHDGLTDDTWQTQAGGRTWLLISVEEQGRRHWALRWEPPQDAAADLRVKATSMVAHLHKDTDQDRSLKDATLYLDQHPHGVEPPAPEPLPTTHTVTEYVPVAKQEVSRNWERCGDVWETFVGDARCVLYRAGGAWVWVGPDVAPITPQHSAERAMEEVTWHLDVQPLITAAQTS